MYFLLLDAILDRYKEQPLVIAEEQQLCATLLTHPELSFAKDTLTFRIDPLTLQRDYIGVTNVPGGILCSAKFLSILESIKAEFFAFPAQLREQDGNQEVASLYYFGVVRQHNEVIDWKRSEAWVDAESERGGHYMTKLVLTQDCEKQEIPIFRPEHALLTLVHEHLRRKLEREKLIGLAFAPLNAIYSPYQGVRELALERMLRKQPGNAKRWTELGDIQISLLRFQEALTTLDRALTLDPKIGRAWYLRGLAFSRLGDQQKALEAYQKATILKELGAWTQMSKLLRQFGRAEEALSLIEQYRGSVWESGRPFWCEIGETYLALGRDEEALAAFEQAILLPGIGRDVAFCGKGAILFRHGRYEEALATYRFGLESRSPELASEIRGLLQGEAMTLRKLGRLEEAAVTEQKLQELEQEREARMHAKPL